MDGSIEHCTVVTIQIAIDIPVFHQLLLPV